MFSKLRLFLLLALLFIFSFSCAPSQQYVWRIEPISLSQNNIENEFFSASISPVGKFRGGGFDSFLLSVVNYSGKNIELNWNKTLYITNGQTSGSFMFEGIVYKDRNNPKPPDIIFPNSTFRKKIFPNNLVHFAASRYGGWMHEIMPPGENGVYLTIIVDGKEFAGKMTMILSREEIH